MGRLHQAMAWNADAIQLRAEDELKQFTDVGWFKPFLGEVESIMTSVITSMLTRVTGSSFASTVATTTAEKITCAVGTTLQMLFKIFMNMKWWKRLREAGLHAYNQQEGLVRACLAYGQAASAFVFETLSQVIKNVMEKRSMSVRQEEEVFIADMLKNMRRPITCGDNVRALPQ